MTNAIRRNRPGGRLDVGAGRGDGVVTIRVPAAVLLAENAVVRSS